MSRIAIRNIDHVTAVSSNDISAIYGGFDWKGLLNNAWNLAKNYLNNNPIRYQRNIGGFDIGLELNGQGVQVGGRKGGFQFGFGFNW
ncbi:MAG: hypothetical protein AB7K09_12805 [Planctomycetota bacterium]